MSKNIKLKDDNYWDSSSISHNKIPLNQFIDGIKEYSGTITKNASVDININTVGFCAVRIWGANFEDIITYSLCVGNKWCYDVSEILHKGYYNNTNASDKVEIVTRDDSNYVFLRFANNGEETLSYKVYIYGMQ